MGAKRATLEAIKDQKNARHVKYKHTFPVEMKSVSGRSSQSKIKFATDIPKNLNVIKHMSPKTKQVNKQGAKALEKERQ